MPAFKPQTGRADLLRALAAGRRHDLALNDDAAHWLGYQRQAVPRRAPRGGLQVPLQPDPDQRQVPPAALPRQPLCMPQRWMLVEQAALPAADTDAGARPPQAELLLLQPADLAPRVAQRLVDFSPLLPWPRLLPALKHHLSQPRQGGLDVPMLVSQLARQQLGQRMPRLARQRWNPDLVVLLDFSPRLWPYRHDMHQLCRQLLRQAPRCGLALRVLSQGPFGGSTDWLAEQGLQPAPPQRQAWVMPLPGAELLIVGDLGRHALARPGGAGLVADWQRFVKQAQQAGVRVSALALLGEDQLDAATAARLPVLRWSDDSRLRRSPGQPAAPKGAMPPPAGLPELLAVVAAAHRVDPPLLRALRRSNRNAPGNAGLEAALWAHADVDAGFSAALRPHLAQPHLQRFLALPATRQLQQRQLRCLHQAHLGASLAAQQDLCWAAWCQAQAMPGPVAQAALALAWRLCQTLAHTLAQPLGQGAAASMQNLADEWLQSADAGTAQQHAALFHSLLAQALIGRPQDAQGPLPAWADAQQMAEKLPPQGPESPSAWWLVEDVALEQLQLQPRIAEAGQLPIGPPLQGPWAVLHHAGQPARWLRLQGDAPVALAPRAGREPLRLLMGGQAATIAPVRRPAGAMAWWSDLAAPPGTVQVAVRGLSGQPVTLQPHGALSLPAVCEPMPTDPDRRWQIVRQHSHEWYADAKADYSADALGLRLRLGLGEVTQDFHWIAPGSFWMGSPATEADRDDDEGPQHRVTISRGFWLANTPCTQALWQFVMGRNPSHFAQGADAPARPIESVSWDDVQAFLQGLRQLLPEGCEPGLPTEAEWEYACRAGTQTAYAWGKQFIDGHANVGSRASTAVFAYPPNPWGLFDMHGNVWEWCADAPRRYQDRPEVDPHGGTEGDYRVLRGGAWRLLAAFARAAFRFRVQRGHARRDDGFRLALRSPGPGGPGLGGPGGPPQAGPAGPGIDAPGGRTRAGSSGAARAAGPPSAPTPPSPQPGRP